MDDLKRVIIDNHELGERLGLKEEDVIRDGKVTNIGVYCQRKLYSE